jgi:hypothetical protein
MITTTWTKAPADLYGPGSSAARGCAQLDQRAPIGVSPAPALGTALPAAGTAARLRPAVVGQADALATFGARTGAPIHNYIDGTTLGIHPSGRPLS